MNEVRRASKREFFISQNIIFDLELSEHAKIAYLYLSRCADNYSNQSFPSYKTIAKKCSFSRSTAISAIKQLELVGLLTYEKRIVKREGKQVNTSNIYTIYDTPKQGLSDCMLDAENIDTANLRSKVVQEIHHPSVMDELGGVQELHYPSVGGIPNKYPDINTNYENTQSIILQNDKDWVDTYDYIREKVMQQIEFHVLKDRHPHNGVIDDILEIIIEVMASSASTIRVNKEDKQIGIIKSTFKKLDFNHIEYVLRCFESQTIKANNVRSYLITALYNAPMTINAYYSNLVSHDMANNF